MKNINLKNNIISAAKWSTMSEILAKIFVLLTNMILARILTPNEFGVVATVTMIISFTDMFTDSGFQKYLVQHDFRDKYNIDLSFNVAFWTNLLISIILFLFIVIFRDQIAIAVGNPGLGMVISTGALSLPLTSFSSIQIAVYKRNLDYKTLSRVRIVGAFIPFIITLPLALFGFGYWSLIIGTVFSDLIKSILLTLKSEWKPRVVYSIKILSNMISLSIWSLLESISIWMTSYIGTFIVGSYLSTYYLGIYKTTMVSVNGIFSIITASSTSILFSALSRLQYDENEFKKVYIKFISIVSIIILPMGVGIYIYRDFITVILLGSQWNEASEFVGIWGLMSSITIILGQFCSEVYRAKGKPKISFLVQILHLIVLIPVLTSSSKNGFTSLIYARTFVKLQQILINWIVMYKLFKISTISIVKDIVPSIISSFIMAYIGINIRSLSMGYIWDIIGIIICIVVYFVVLMLFPSSKKEIILLIKKLNIQPNKYKRLKIE